jgi:hypothetical protein
MFGERLKLKFNVLSGNFILLIIMINSIYAKVGHSKFVEMHGEASDFYRSAFYTRHRVNITIYRTVYLLIFLVEAYTVKPVLAGHSWGMSKVTSQER